jgi:CheY-like chemotaxis protein
MGSALPGKSPVVLVVEDESVVLFSAVEMVTEAGFDAIPASNADDAIRILERRDDIRAVFTDVQMPGSMDGLRLARVVRNRWPPVAVVVTSGQRQIAQPTYPAECGFLVNPISLPRLKQFFDS